MDGKVLAAKELEKRRFMKNGQLDKKLDNEMKIMRSLRHPNIVEFKEYVDQGDYMYIIMEFVRHGDLQQYLKRNRRLEESQARAMAQQILSALSYLHRSNITHRDIKPDNILISEVEPFTVKLSDFGLSKVVQHQETFLKTFCGTLLYCAPEVFPFYEKTKGTKRTRGAKQGFHSYSSSVDIWSFAGVLWYSLCGSPPFEGVADQTGQAMFNNIMTTKVDPSPLRQANVSEQCIDLLCKMLQTDPALRPTDAQCLSHPWLREGAMIPPEVGLHSIVEEDEEEVAKEQLSQLSIHEEDASDDEAEGVLDDEEFGRLISNRAPKRVRTDCRFPRNQLRDKDDLSSAEVSYDREALRAITGSHIIRDSFLHDNPHSGRPRLFGEIGRSALESSGILNARADGTLSHAGSDGQILPDDALPCNVTPTRKALDRSQVTPLSSEHNAQPDSSFSSPSLLGAESLVRELNMASPQSPGSGVQSPNEPATPKTPEVHQHSSLGDTSQSQFSDATPKAKPPALNRQITLPNRPSRQISLPKTASFYYDPFDPSTHNLEYASKVSGIDFVSGSEKSASTETESDAQKSQDQLVTQSAVPSLSMELGIKPPPRRLGKLTTTPDSFIPHFSLMIDQARTSWGRHPDATVVYGDPFDTRIPKLAFVIIWYRRNANSPTVQELSQQGKDWTTVDDLHAAIFTAASSGISINGKLLRKADDKGRPLYGNIHTGDIIQVFQDARTSECLKFKCEFYHSAAKEPRPPGQSFHIRAGNKNML
jgi:serine/threonine protein kinase